jgi:hypothetical protein
MKLKAIVPDVVRAFGTRASRFPSLPAEKSMENNFLPAVPWRRHFVRDGRSGGRMYVAQREEVSRANFELYAYHQVTLRRRLCGRLSESHVQLSCSCF